MRVARKGSFVIALSDIKTDPVTEALVTVTEVSISDEQPDMGKLARLCCDLEMAIGKYEQIRKRLISVSVKHDGLAIVLVVFGVWVPDDLVIIFSELQGHVEKPEQSEESIWYPWLSNEPDGYMPSLP